MEILKYLKVKIFSGSGSGYGYGDGSGYGSGYGSGDGSGYGYGDGSGYKIKLFNNENVYYVDGLPCVFKTIKGNIAKVKLIDKITYQDSGDCYIAKNDYFFAHGETIKEAINELNNKYYANCNIETKIDQFKKLFVDGKVSNQVLFDWHGILTGSCLLGRTRFAKEHSINLKGKMSLDEFINLTINHYGGEVIRRLKE